MFFYTIILLSVGFVMPLPKAHVPLNGIVQVLVMSALTSRPSWAENTGAEGLAYRCCGFEEKYSKIYFATCGALITFAKDLTST